MSTLAASGRASARAPARAGGRLLFVLACLMLWAAGVVTRLGYLQVAAHESFRLKADRQQQRVVELDAPRGTIYDARGRELAVSVAVDSAYAVPKAIADKPAAAAAIAAVLGEKPRDVLDRLEAGREFVWIARKLDRPQATRLRALELPGLGFLEESKRYYPMRELAAHVLGYVGLDNLGLSGLELQYEKTVAGKSARRTVLRDARRGTALDPDLSFVTDAQPGADLYLTIDATIQNITERELAAAVLEHNAKHGMAVVLDPRTGALLALASWPTFDPNHFNGYGAEVWRNRTLADAYEPGSTFKIITAAAALEHNLVDPSDVFDCEMGSITLLNTRIGDHKPFGLLSFRDILAKSSNVGAVKIGLKVGAERLAGMIQAFGFGRTTGVDLPGESAGIVRPVERWQPLSKAYISFGQEISITPLQLAVAAGAVANGGTLYAPYVVNGIGNGVQVVAQHRTPQPLGQPISATTARTLERMLEAVVAEGTAKAATIVGYPVAGKPGTAQKADAGGYSANRFVASFVGFAPARDARVLAAVVIDEPHPGYHGGEVAAPAFARIVDQTLLYLGYTPDRERPERWPFEREPAAAPADPGGLVAAVADPGAEGSGTALPVAPVVAAATDLTTVVSETPSTPSRGGRR